MTSAAEVIEARRLRDTARGIVRTDIATVRLELAERSIPMRVRDRVVLAAVQTAEDAVELASENRAIVGLTLASVLGWLLRSPLTAMAGTLSGRACFLLRRAFERWRA